MCKTPVTLHWLMGQLKQITAVYLQSALHPERCHCVENMMSYLSAALGREKPSPKWGRHRQSAELRVFQALTFFYWYKIIHASCTNWLCETACNKSREWRYIIWSVACIWGTIRGKPSGCKWLLSQACICLLIMPQPQWSSLQPVAMETTPPNPHPSLLVKSMWIGCNRPPLEKSTMSRAWAGTEENNIHLAKC